MLPLHFIDTKLGYINSVHINIENPSLLKTILETSFLFLSSKVEVEVTHGVSFCWFLVKQLIFHDTWRVQLFIFLPLLILGI